MEKKWWLADITRGLKILWLVSIRCHGRPWRPDDARGYPHDKTETSYVRWFKVALYTLLCAEWTDETIWRYEFVNYKWTVYICDTMCIQWGSTVLKDADHGWKMAILMRCPGRNYALKEMLHASPQNPERLHVSSFFFKTESELNDRNWSSKWC